MTWAGWVASWWPFSNFPSAGLLPGFPKWRPPVVCPDRLGSFAALLFRAYVLSAAQEERHPHHHRGHLSQTVPSRFIIPAKAFTLVRLSRRYVVAY